MCACPIIISVPTIDARKQVTGVTVGIRKIRTYNQSSLTFLCVRFTMALGRQSYGSGGSWFLKGRIRQSDGVAE